MKACPHCQKRCEDGDYIGHLRLHKQIALRVMESGVRDGIVFNYDTRTWECSKCKANVYTNPDIHALWHQIAKLQSKKVANTFLDAIYEASFTDRFHAVLSSFLEKYLPLTKKELEGIEAELVQEIADRQASAEIEAMAEATVTES